MSGLLYLVLLTLIPATALRVVWKKYRSLFFVWLLLAPAFAFVFGGFWLAVSEGAFRVGDAPEQGISPSGVFIFGGVVLVYYCALGLAVVGGFFVLWRLTHPVPSATLGE